MSGLSPDDETTFTRHPRVRRIVVRCLPHWPLTSQYPHWSNGDDLDTLDELLVAGPGGEDDVAGALPAEVVELRCRACGTASRSSPTGPNACAPTVASNTAVTAANAGRPMSGRSAEGTTTARAPYGGPGPGRPVQACGS